MYNLTINNRPNVTVIRSKQARYFVKRPQREVWIGKRLTVYIVGRMKDRAFYHRIESVETSTFESSPFEKPKARSPPS